MTNEDLPADRDERARALEAVLKGRTLARSDQLQEFLRYICELELAGRGDEITEYSIATGALNRPTNYNPGEDSSVRSRAHALRRKLQEYYESESPEAEWRIELPKGSYRPLFVKAPAEPAAVAATEAERKPRLSGQVWGFLLGISLAVAIGAIVIAALAARWRGERMDSLVREAWGPVLEGSADVLIVVTCPPLGRILSAYPGLVPKVNKIVETPAEIAAWYQGLNVEHRGGPVYMFPSRGYASFSDTLAATEVGSLVTLAGGTFQAVPEPTVLPMGVHERGLVLIGAPPHNAFMARLLKLTPFSVHFDPAQNDEVISEGAPGVSKSVFIAKRNEFTNRFSKVYGLITVLPSQPGRDRPERTVVFSGIAGSPGAQAAVQYFSSAAALRDLKERFRKQGFPQFPPAYQVVVRSGVDAEVAINSVYETHRIMSKPPVIE